MEKGNRLSVMKKKRHYPRRVDPNSIPEIAKRLRMVHSSVAKMHPELTSHTAFAAYVGISRNAWWNYEKGHGRISVDAAMKLYERFGVSLDWIYENDPKQMPYWIMSHVEVFIRNANDDSMEGEEGVA